MELGQYVAALRRTWWLTGTGVVLGLLVGGLVAVLTPPTYVSTVQFMVSIGPQPGEAPGAAFQLAQQRIASYVVLARSDQLAADVSTDLGGRLPPAEIAAMLDATSVINTAVVSITVTGHDRTAGREVADSLVTEFPQLVLRLDPAVEELEVNAVGEPRTPTAPHSPDRPVDLLLGLAAGLLVGLVAAVLHTFFDTRVRDAASVTRLLAAPVLARLDGTAGAATRSEQLPLIGLALDARPGRGRLLVTAVDQSSSVASSALAGRLVETFADRADRVVLDGPLLLPTADAASAAGRADTAVVVVLTLGRTTAATLTAARDRLAVVGAVVLGAVVVAPGRVEGRHGSETPGAEVGPRTVEQEDGDRGRRERPVELSDRGRG